jgi:hypothetical protein
MRIETLRRYYLGFTFAAIALALAAGLLTVHYNITRRQGDDRAFCQRYGIACAGAKR